MRLLNKKSRLQRVLHTMNDSLDVPGGVKFGLPDIGSGNPLKAGLPRGRAIRAGVIAGSLAGLTAASAGVSSLRRRTEGARDNS